MKGTIPRMTKNEKILSFERFSKLKVYVKSLLLRSVHATDEIDPNRTASNVWSAMNALPTTIKEQIFEDVLERKFTDQSIINIKSESQQQRNKAVDLLLNTSPIPALETFQKGKIFKLLDKIFCLKDKHFDTVSVETAVNSLPKNTSSAYPYFVKKGTILEENISKVNYIFNTRDDSWMNDPCVIRWRTQQRKSGVKYRQFYMYGYHILSLEMMYAKPFFDHFQANKSTSYCFANVFNDLAPKFKGMRKSNFILSLDYSSFDQLVTANLLKLAFTYVKSHLKLNNETKRINFENMVRYNINCCIATKKDDNCIIFRKSQGVMSGSVFTNFIDSIINGIMIISFLLENNEVISIENILIMGDDCLIGVSKPYSVKDVNLFMNKHFKSEISIEKSELYKNDTVTFYFLGYDMNEFGRYSNEELIQRQLIFSESFIPETVLPTKVRLFSKLASLLFKTSDGNKLWDIYSPKLANYLGCEIPTTFVEIYSISGEPIDLSKTKSIEQFKTEGWRIQ